MKINELLKEVLKIKSSVFERKNASPVYPEGYLVAPLKGPYNMFNKPADGSDWTECDNDSDCAGDNVCSDGCYNGTYIP